MKTADLIAAGQALYGPAWQSSLARALRNSEGEPLNTRTVRLWIEGKRSISSGAEKQILHLLVDQQVKRIDEVLSNFALEVNGVFTFAVYNSDDDLRQCTGERWTAAFHAQMIGGILHRLRKRGIDARVTPMAAPEYFKWLGRRPNTSKERSTFAGLQMQAHH